jgi:hypothetical protein
MKSSGVEPSSMASRANTSRIRSCIASTLMGQAILPFI